ncbi:hypothetical protein F8388_000613 [Cannabis sativa]|uniref:Reverse transcriptase zinc-binding domain-containing protein n=1 Tax=Cannabis sativa TaxID=3483 RepID=A0A7J6GIH3_CANSA|nr:hypothetical protein G4B88_018350 [Cannabis sativa]KAF4381919.1 hypothetical protein F8388_000613 [Cannabis sativa]
MEVGKSCLMGRFCSNKNVNRSLIRTILGRVWRLEEVDWGVKIKRVTTEATFMVFSFKKENDLNRIIDKSPWLLNNGILLLQRFSKIPTNWEEEMTRFPLSGRVLNLLTKSISKNNMMRLAGTAGEVIDIQKEDVMKIAYNEYFWFKNPSRGKERNSNRNDYGSSLEQNKNSNQAIDSLEAEERMKVNSLDHLILNFGNSRGKMPERLPRINNRNSTINQVPTPNSLLYTGKRDLNIKGKDKLMETQTPGDGGVVNKKRSGNWDSLIQEDDLSMQPGKRLHMDDSNLMMGPKQGIHMEEGDWIDIPINFAKDIGEGSSGPKGGKKQKRVTRKNCTSTSKNTLRQMINKAGDRKLDALEEKMNKDDIPLILGIQTMRDCGEDELIWNPTIDGEYTVASSYRMKQSEKEGAETSNKSITKGWWTAVWHSNLTPKIKNFIWRVCHNWVPSKTELAKRGIKLDRTCTGCWNQIETISHAIWQCPRLKYVWKETGLWHLFPKSLGLMSDLMEFLMFMKNKCSNQDFERFLGMSWMVWSQRNNQIFQNKNPPLKSWTPWALDFVNHALTKATDIKDKKRDKSH